jgi:protein-arginine kinase activator protein McsA
MIDQIIEILFEEDNSRVVAIYGGGFKPPTKGHFSVVEKTLEDFPEIDELKVFVGSGVRDGITQDQSIKIWDIYTKYLTPKIDIQSSIAPVKSIFDYSKEHPEEKIYWILGVREDNEDDLKDLENRTKSLEKYPNIEVKAIITADGVSGTKARAALLSGNKEEFFKLIPDIADEEKEQIWDLLTPVVKEEEINEADPKKGTGKKPEGSGRRLYTDEDPKDTVGISFKTKEDIVDTLNKASFKAKSHARQSQIINLIHQRVRAAYENAKDPEVKARLKRGLDYIEDRKEASKKKTERLNKMKEASDPQAGTALPYGSGFAPVKEVVTATEIICDNCGWKWKIADGGKDLYTCHKCGHDNTPKNDPFGLKEYAKEFVKEVFKEDRNIKEGMLSLSKYMVNNGMNIKPLPKVKIIDNDAKNASDLLGKTAYYNPQEKSITLYTMNRHPKDVLRSFAHEMVHHQQNLEGRLNNINTTNTNEDGDLPEIEREAYEKGNMMFRNWEDNIKNV